jgi:hypothetical protein
MTCRDIIIKELKRLGADGLTSIKAHHICQCTPDDWSFLCGHNGGINCVPAKLVNGKWEPVKEKEYCEWKLEDDLTGQHYETTCDNAIMFTSGGLRDNGYGYKYCPYCQLEIREVKP